MITQDFLIKCPTAQRDRVSLPVEFFQFLSLRTVEVRRQGAMSKIGFLFVVTVDCKIDVNPAYFFLI